MSEKEKKEIAQRLTTRVSTGLMFIEFEYLNRHSTPDTAWIRNIYILLSFYSELLLKAIFVIKKDFANITTLDKKLRKMGHNLVTASKQIGKEELLAFGIRNVRLKNREYIVETNDGDFFVKDFNDIRYDFLDGRVRTLNGNEHKMFRKQIDIMFEINKKLSSLVW